jgi:Ca-activated chloride channel family protein
MSQTQTQAERKTPSGDEDAMQPKNAQGEQEGDDTEQALPAGELTAASEQNAEDKTGGRVAAVEPGEEEGLMTKEEALKMLQAVRDRDMLRRLRHEQIERSRHIPVDRDW